MKKEINELESGEKKEKVTLINKTKACFFELKISKYFAILTKKYMRKHKYKAKGMRKGI